MTAFLRGRLVGRRPLSIATIALFGAVVVLLLCVWLAVYRPAALALAGATFIVILTWLSDRRERARRARLRAVAAAVGPVPGPTAPKTASQLASADPALQPASADPALQPAGADPAPQPARR